MILPNRQKVTAMATLRVNVSAFRRLMEERGWNERDLAAHMGLAPSYVNRVLNAKRQPGGKFMAGALALGMRVEEAFIVELDDPKGEPRPEQRTADGGPKEPF